MAVIQTAGLSKRYGDRWAVDRLDLQVEQGDIYGFIGRNGAGKSTTLKLLCGLARPTRGEALIFGKPIRDLAARRRVGRGVQAGSFRAGRSFSGKRSWKSRRMSQPSAARPAPSRIRRLQPTLSGASMGPGTA